MILRKKYINIIDNFKNMFNIITNLKKNKKNIIILYYLINS